MVVENFPANPIHAHTPHAALAVRRHPRWLQPLLVCAALLQVAAATADDCSGHVHAAPQRSRPGGIEGRLGYYQPILPTRSFYAPAPAAPGWREGYQAGFHDGRHAAQREQAPRAGGWGADRFRPSNPTGHASRAREGFAWRQGYRD